MKTTLETFPKYHGKYYPDHKQGVNLSEKELAEIGKEAIAWRSAFEQELKDRLEDAQRKEFGVGDWPYEYGRNKATQALITEILGPQLSRILVVPKQGEK
jgi:hypothetical protein